jgi:3-methyl-2-oxobutanoate hydroxymethyltransferase
LLATAQWILNADCYSRGEAMRVTIADIREMKQKKEKIPMLTAYDYVTAKMVDQASVPLILVGDSLGMVMLGYESTIPVTMDEMIHHTKAVVRGAKNALVVGDMPFMTYHISVSDALKNAGRFIQEAGAQAVKLEGGEVVAETVRRLVDCGVPVMGHIGLTPQSIHQLGGFKVWRRLESCSMMPAYWRRLGLLLSFWNALLHLSPG